MGFLLVQGAAKGAAFPGSFESPTDSDANPPARLDEDSPEVRVDLVAEGFDAPVFLTEPDDDSGRLFVVDQSGTIRIVGPDGELLPEPFLDVSDKLVELVPEYDERGLLGMAFHPEYAQNGRFFVFYSAPLRDSARDDWDNTGVLEEYQVSSDPDVADPDSGKVLFQVDEPFENHNGGQMVFGDDGFLYLALGDGGNGGDSDPDDDQRGRPERGNAQSVDNPLGAVLRLDVNGAQPYAVPDDNPLVGKPGMDEIFTYGHRNPYGLSKDLDSGDLYVFEAGQALYEEVNLLEAGGNYGWNIREGPVCFDPDDFLNPPETCRRRGYMGEPLIEPVLAYQRSPQVGSVVVPGVLYRGESIPEFQGKLLFGDYSRIRFIPEGLLYVGEPEEGGPGEVRQVRVVNTVDRRSDGSLNRFLLGVSQDLEGDAYAMTTRAGGPTGGTGQVLLLSSADSDPQGRSWVFWLIVGLGVMILATVVLLLVRRYSPANSGRDP